MSKRICVIAKTRDSRELAAKAERLELEIVGGRIDRGRQRKNEVGASIARHGKSVP